MSEHRHMKEFTRLRATRSGGEGVDTPACLDEHVVAALADGSIAASMRVTAMAHLATCEPCRRAVAAVAAALSDPEVRQAMPARTTTRAGFRPRWIGLAAGLAAAVLLVVFVRPATRTAPGPHRGPITAAPAPKPTWPVGAVEDGRRLSWTTVPGADRYRVTLFDPSGSVRFERETTDTFVEIPGPVAPTPGGMYAWTVDARVGYDRWVRSDLVRFSVER